MKHSILRYGLAAGLLSVLVACSDMATSKADAAVDPTSTIFMANQPGVPNGWVTDFKGALELAKKENRPVLIDFTGSDWCGWCKKLDREIFSKDAFKEYAKDNLVLLYLDFPSGKPQSDDLKAQNAQLQKEFGVRGFPTLVLLSPDGKKIWENVGYLKGGPDAMIAAINKATGK
ncbi:thioredoxin family protein [Ruficoccus sp. ZRK36]|uniref:thioredoxin family protein n=1 Tax=Ruficoccus sp. ZRK36 TaxID=2866311 RepID=UPI001C737AC6|nr:thioredoxin family protein [Ruficoccus sp. ZRK36]QYY35668.1 thioredoxin family protein [Ruficoccus sp. ZRK36]